MVKLRLPTALNSHILSYSAVYPNVYCMIIIWVIAYLKSYEVLFYFTVGTPQLALATWCNECGYKIKTRYTIYRSNDINSFIEISLPDNVASIFILRWNPVLW